MAIDHICSVIGVQVNEMSRLCVILGEAALLLHRYPLLLKLLDLPHIHVVDAWGGAQGGTFLVVADHSLVVIDTHSLC